MSGAVTAVAATVVAMTAAEVFTAVAIAGAVVGAIGAVTGIKPLQYAGIALGAIGGIGGLALSAGIIGADAATAGAGVATDAGSWGAGAVSDTVGAVQTGATSFSDALAGVADSTGTTLAGGATTAAAPMDAIDTVTGQASGSMTATPQISGGETNVVTAESPPEVVPDVNPQPAASTAPPAAQTSTASSPPPGGQTPNGPVSPTVAPPAAPAAPTALATGAPAPGTTVVGAPLTAAQQTANLAGATPIAPFGGTLGPASTNPFSDILAFVGKPGVSPLIAGAIQAGGAFIAGATSTLTPAQVAAYNAQAQANLAAANLTTQQANLSQLQQTNIAQPIPVARRTPSPGLINSPPVTGATA